jgi:Tol biopolymer transport system component
MGMEAGLVGQTLGAYRIVEQIGRGGMATVYKAYEPALDRYVAIKILPHYFAHDPDFAARFEREAKAVARLNHPNILPIYSFGQEGGLSYIAMRYVEAGTLKEMLGEPLDLKTAADILGQIGRALDYAHQRGIVHRDVKPTNVLMAEGKWALLTDFGLARMVESSVQLTKTGVGVGTPAYMSPEQGQGLKVDARSDVYSLGVALYEMVTGRVPYEAETPMAVVLKHITAPLPLPREVNAELPEVVERVILKAMAKAPEDRYQTAGELVEALEKAVAGVPVVEKPPEVKPTPVAEVPSTLVAEPTPAPAVTVPVEAPPVAKKGLPGWAWGVVGAVGAVILLVVAGGVFLATREKPSPTPGATAALAATPTSLPLAVPTATPTSLKSISPGKPPMDALEVQPCQWDNRGPGLCIFPSGDGAPIKILTDTELEISGPPSWSPDGQRIAFSALEPGESEDSDNTIYIVNADGGGLTELPPVGNDISPAWSPDGQWLAFHSNGSLAIMHPDGSAPTVIWDGKGKACTFDPQWSPDGQWIAVSMQIGGCEWTFPMTREVWVISRDGATVNTVATITHENGECLWPDVAFSLDGTQVAYNDANCKPWIVNADGSGQATPLTEFPFWWKSAVQPQWGARKEALPPKPASPAWLEGKFVGPCEGVKPPQICVWDAPTGQVTQVTKNLESDAIDGAAWSPDGQQIIFDAGSDPAATNRYDHKLYVISADGSNLRQITSGDTHDNEAAWSPDGQWIAFRRNCGLWVIRPDGSDGRRLLEESPQFCAGAVAWSFDGQQTAFSNLRGPGGKIGPREIWVVNSDGTDPHVVYSFEQPLEWVDVGWSPDGRQIFCRCWDSSGEKDLLINADGSGGSKIIEKDMAQKLRSWLSNFWPQWGGKKETLPVTTPAPPAPVSRCGPGETELLFEDFEDGQAQGWQFRDPDGRLAEPWAIEAEGGNHFLVGSGHRWADVGGSAWRDYVLHVKVRSAPGSAHLNVRNGRGRYHILFPNGGLRRGHPGEVVVEWEGVQDNDWHTLTLSAVGGHVEAYLDDELVAVFDDPEPFLYGPIGLENLDGRVWYDDVLVCERPR